MLGALIAVLLISKDHLKMADGSNIQVFVKAYAEVLGWVAHELPLAGPLEQEIESLLAGAIIDVGLGPPAADFREPGLDRRLGSVHAARRSKALDTGLAGG